MRRYPVRSGGNTRLLCSLLLTGACWFGPGSSAAHAFGWSLKTRIDSVLQKAYPADAPGAAVVVTQGGRIVLRQGFGLADVARKVPVSPDDTFRIGSITKQFTAVAILQLAAKGQLRLDDEITRYVPEFPVHGQRITLAQLLAHTSGIPNYTAEAGFRAIPEQDLSLAQILAFVRDRPLNFPPGTRWSYCNTGYVLLGAVIERVSGQSYAAYLQDHILGPAGLTHTYYGRARMLAPGQIQGYSRTLEGSWVNAKYLNATQAYAAGALVSDVDDLWRWEKFLNEGSLLRSDLLALARSPARFDGGRQQADYGFGWELGSVDGRPTAGHGGTISGFRTYEVSVPSLGLYVAILCNADRPRSDPQTVAEQIVRLAAKDHPAPPRLGLPLAAGWVGSMGKIVSN